MKIISIAPAHPLRGGIADFNETLTKALMSNGHDASIVSYSLQYPAFLFPGKTQFTDSLPPENIKIASILNSINPFSWLKTANYIVQQKPELVIIHFWMPFFAPALGTIARKLRKKKIKVILLCHNIVPHESAFYDKILTKYIVKPCHGYITLAQSVFDDLNQFTSSTTKIIAPHPIYDIFGQAVDKGLARTKLGLKERDKYILFFGMVRKYKGLDLLLEAMGEKILKDLNIKLIIAGEFYDKLEYYDEIIDRHDLEDRVIIHNQFISSEMVKYYFSAADMITQTYHTATQSGISQIAYSFDKPMLVTNVGGLSEIVPHKMVGYVVEKEKEKIAEAIADFYKYKREVYFSINARIEKERFSWHFFVKKLEELVSILKN